MNETAGMSPAVRRRFEKVGLVCARRPRVCALAGMMLLAFASQEPFDVLDWLRASLQLPEMTQGVAAWRAIPMHATAFIYIIWTVCVFVAGRGPKIRDEAAVAVLPHFWPIALIAEFGALIFAFCLLGLISTVAVHMTDASPGSLILTWRFWLTACAWLLAGGGTVIALVQGFADAANIRARVEEIEKHQH